MRIGAEQMTAQIQKLISESLHRLRQHPKFSAWLLSEKVGQEDIILINNSFVFRDVKTIKSDKFISLYIKDSPAEPEIGVASGIRLNADFKRFTSVSSNIPVIYSVKEAVDLQLEHLGQLVFLLIGEVEDKEVVETNLNHAAFSKVVWDPTIPEVTQIAADRIAVRSTDDEDEVWQSVTAHYATNKCDTPEGLRDALGTALDQLQDQAVACVRIPLPGQNAKIGITDAILTVLREQRNDYASAVTDYIDSQSDSALNNVLRIAYNFSSDATGFLRLIVSVCDLKPVVLWGTIAEHYTLSEAFRSLPWSRSNKKPSLHNYHQSIADARNSAFHNLFPFRKSLRVPLPETALGKPELQIFSEHSKKSSNQLTYQDKELVDVLMEFTRARERRLSPSFWQNNLEVMDATICLFDQTNKFIKELAQCRTK
jgi:hypothetical protein